MVRFPDQLEQSKAANILIVDDEAAIRIPLARAFSSSKYQVKEARSGREALALLEHSPFDLMVLDMQMPNMDGMEVMTEARKRYPQLLILILTGHPTVDNAIAAVKQGAGDYICKPATLHEIMETVARLLQEKAQRLYHEHVARTVTHLVSSAQEIRDGPGSVPPSGVSLNDFVQVYPLILDLQTHEVTVDGPEPRMARLSKSEACVLAELMSRPDHVFSCRDLVKVLWDNDADELDAESVIRLHIYRLRRKIELDPRNPDFIRTVRGQGYLFVDPKDQASQ